MKNTNAVFSSATVALPAWSAEDARWQKWAVIACDQFTSEMEYWKETEAICEGSPSALDLILPEAYLGTGRESVQRARIESAMPQMDGVLHTFPDSLLYVEREIPDGRIRRGLVGKVDLEAYEYRAGSQSAVRATEATVLERIPPRVAIRAQARYELPHVMLLMDDTMGLMESVAARRDQYARVYDFPLMQGGGRIAGYRIFGQELAEVETRIAAYEASLRGKMTYAVGDGNHSLAAAKAHYENLKTTLGKAAEEHPARYALVELVALQDPALDFEPIYRIVTGCRPAELLTALEQVAQEGTDGQTVRVLCFAVQKDFRFVSPTHALTVGTLQDFLDDYIAKHPGVRCDYIHDASSLQVLSRGENTVAFQMDGMQKEELFPYVRNCGTLPRKTFSMGEARSKRYYVEARKII